MNGEKVIKLEKNSKLKKKIFGKNIWKNYAIIPPSLLLFIGILGLVYLLNIDMLKTLYAIPFAIIFVLGTIWFKATKKHLLNKAISETKIFQVCLSIPLTKQKNKTIMLFSSEKNRNNKYYLENIKKDLLKNEQIDLESIGKEITQVDDSSIYLTTLPLSTKFSGTSSSNGTYWLVYTGASTVTFLGQADLKKYAQI